jgi:SAM-dependent methyltransferase
LTAGETCPLCSGTGTRLGEKDGAEVRECAAGHAPVLLAWPWPDPCSYARWYAEGVFHTEQQVEEGFSSYADAARDQEFRGVARLRLQFLACFAPPAGQFLMDVGCGTGAFVYEAVRAGYRASGLDPCVAMVKRWGGPLRPLSVGSWRETPPLQEIITLHDVLEHLAEPLACLSHLRECLAPDGLLVVEMPEWRQQGLSWRCVRPKQHLALFSREAAEEFYTRAGLEVIAFTRPLRGTIGKMSHYLVRTP